MGRRLGYSWCCGCGRRRRRRCGTICGFTSAGRARRHQLLQLVRPTIRRRGRGLRLRLNLLQSFIAVLLSLDCHDDGLSIGGVGSHQLLAAVAFLAQRGVAVCDAPHRADLAFPGRDAGVPCARAPPAGVLRAGAGRLSFAGASACAGVHPPRDADGPERPLPPVSRTPLSPQQQQQPRDEEGTSCCCRQSDYRCHQHLPSQPHRLLKSGPQELGAVALASQSEAERTTRGSTPAESDSESCSYRTLAEGHGRWSTLR